MTCRICGWEGVLHQGAVDCIAQYRLLVDDLRRLLPRGKQVLSAPIDRDVTARLWIDGEATAVGLDRLVTYIEFMKKAWHPETAESQAIEVELPTPPEPIQ